MLQNVRICGYLVWVWRGWESVYQSFAINICFFIFKYYILQLIKSIFPHGPPAFRINHDLIVKDYKFVEMLKFILRNFVRRKKYEKDNVFFNS